MSVLRLLAVAVTLVIAAIVSVLAWANWPIHLHHGVIEVTIPPKTSMQGIARMVSDSGAPIPALLFDVLARADGRATHIQAGTYAIEEGMTPLSVLARMERGEVIQIELVIPEGWTFHQMRAAVASDADLQQTVAALERRRPDAPPGRGREQSRRPVFSRTPIVLRAARPISRFIGAPTSRWPSICATAGRSAPQICRWTLPIRR